MSGNVESSLMLMLVAYFPSLFLLSFLARDRDGALQEYLHCSHLERKSVV